MLVSKYGIYFLAVSLAFPVYGATMRLTSGQLSFTAIGSPGILKIRGTSNDTFPKGQIEIKNGEAQGELSFGLVALDTGIELRDKHMKNKYLEVEKFPEAKLKVAGLKISEAEMKSGAKRQFSGVLTLHGETKEVAGEFELTGQQKLKAHFPIAVSDFKIDVPKYMGITVSETVEIDLEAQLQVSE